MGKDYMPMKVHILGGNNDENSGLDKIGLNSCIYNDNIMVDAGNLLTNGKGEYEMIVHDNVDLISKVDALLLTHGHEDHVGGARHTIARGISKPPIFIGSEYTLIREQMKLYEMGIKSNKWPKMREIKPYEQIFVSGTPVTAIPISHSIPGSYSYIIGHTYHTGDYRISNSMGGIGVDTDLGKISHLCEKNRIKNVLIESTNAGVYGRTTINRDIAENFEKILLANSDKIVCISFISSNVPRFIEYATVATLNGYTIFTDGHALNNSLKTMAFMSHTDQDKKGNFDIYSIVERRVKEITGNSGCFPHIIDAGELKEIPKNKKFIFMQTGVNADPFAIYNKIATLGNYKGQNLNENFLLLMSQNVIPGNEGRVDAMLESFLATGVNVQFTEHNSGHATNPEHEMLLQALTRKLGKHNFTVIPNHGNTEHRMHMENLAKRLGLHVVNASNGDILDLTPGEVRCIDNQGLRTLGIRLEGKQIHYDWVKTKNGKIIFQEADIYRPFTLPPFQSGALALKELERELSRNKAKSNFCRYSSEGEAPRKVASSSTKTYSLYNNGYART